MKITVIDNGYCDRNGHHYHMNLTIHQECQRRGIPTDFYLQKDLEDEFKNTLNANGLFDDSLYAIYQINNPYVSQDVENFDIKNNLFFQKLLTIDRTKFSPSDIIFFHTCNHNNLGGIAEWLRLFSGEDMPNIALCVGFPDAHNNRQAASLYRYAYRRMPYSAKIRLYTNTQACLKIYEKLFSDMNKFKIYELPIILTPIPMADQTKAASSPLRIGYFGHGRDSKGLHLLGDIVEKANEKNSNIEFYIQFSAHQDTAFKPSFDKLEQQKNVRLFLDSLSSEEYYRTMQECDIILLPYSKDFYSICNSGIFSESMALGKVIVLPSETEIKNIADQYQASIQSFEEFSVENIAEALQKTIENFDDLSNKSKEMSPKFLAKHNIKNCFDILFETMNIDGNPQ